MGLAQPQPAVKPGANLPVASPTSDGASWSSAEMAPMTSIEHGEDAEGRGRVVPGHGHGLLDGEPAEDVVEDVRRGARPDLAEPARPERVGPVLEWANPLTYAIQNGWVYFFTHRNSDRDRGYDWLLHHYDAIPENRRFNLAMLVVLLAAAVLNGFRVARSSIHMTMRAS